jgi:hypothetical protein
MNTPQTIDPQEIAWFNYVTEKYEYRTTPEDFANYLPQDRSAQALYGLYMQAYGLTPIQSAKRVLMACIGETEAVQP